MKKIIIINVLVNLIIGIIFVALNNWMLNEGFEESFVALSVVFTFVYIFANGLFYYVNGSKNNPQI